MIWVGTKGFNYEYNLKYMKYLEELNIPYEKLIERIQVDLSILWGGLQLVISVQLIYDRQCSGLLILTSLPSKSG